MNLLEKLNPAQQQAVKQIDGPLLILAGAGSGKTRVLTYRIAHLMQNCGVLSDEILALTFTNKAAREMRQRLSEILKVSNNWYFMPWMGTFHGICVKMLRESAQEIGLDKKFVIYDENDKKTLIKQAVKENNITDKTFSPQKVIAQISKAKNSLLTPAEYRSSAKTTFAFQVADVFETYEKLKKRSRALDFDDLLLEVLHLLQSKPVVRQHYRQLFKHILVDEYQDTNQIQYQITKLLVNQSQNICVVGDDWQSIYSWRGADFTNILNFKKDYPAAIEIKLEQNYRSTNQILSLAQKVIEHNQQRTDKKLWTDNQTGKDPQFLMTADNYQEAQMTAELIQQAVANGHRLKDIAVLYRTNGQSLALEQALLKANIDHKIIGGNRFFDRRVVKDALAYLRLLFQPSDTVSLIRIINVPARGIGKVTLEKLLTAQKSLNQDFLTVINQLDGLGFSASIIKKFASFKFILTELVEFIATHTAPADILEQILGLTKYRQSLANSIRGEEDETDLNELVNFARSYTDVQQFLEDVSLISSADQTITDDQVSLMTIHASKGLEYPVVILVGMEDGIFPHSRVFESPAELEEERRLCYVALTRAKQELYLLATQSRLTMGKFQYSEPSRFLAEMGLIESIYPPINIANVYDQESDIVNQFEIGDKVKSRQFGVGVVFDIDGLAVSVKFEDGKTRKLNIEYANLTKL